MALYAKDRAKIRSGLRRDNEVKGPCKICGRIDLMHIDHDHISGTIRGLLCVKCNTGLGQFNEDPDLMTRATEYLKYWKSKDKLGY